MNKVIGLLIITMLLLFSACGGDSQDTNLENGQVEINIVTDSLSIEMEALKEDIEQTADELDSLLEEID